MLSACRHPLAEIQPKRSRAARDFAVATVQRWGAAECADDVAIVVSELVTNALRHALPDPRQVRGEGRSGLACCGPGPHAVLGAGSPTWGWTVPAAKEADGAPG